MPEASQTLCDKSGHWQWEAMAITAVLPIASTPKVVGPEKYDISRRLCHPSFKSFRSKWYLFHSVAAVQNKQIYWHAQKSIQGLCCEMHSDLCVGLEHHVTETCIWSASCLSSQGTNLGPVHALTLSYSILLLNLKNLKLFSKIAKSFETRHQEDPNGQKLPKVPQD